MKKFEKMVRSRMVKLGMDQAEVDSISSETIMGFDGKDPQYAANVIVGQYFSKCNATIKVPDFMRMMERM